jgi:putative radical SAM enzyme (TIGR03279 family)
MFRSIDQREDGWVSAPITDIISGSIADEMSIEPGDFLLSINGQEIKDIIDYQFYSQDDYIVLEIEKASGELWSLEIEKSWDEELGLIFADVIFDRMKVCGNRCLFCFVDQLPSGMRKTLYIKDDDYRYSFLYGNFITMTNLREKDWHKITTMHLSPLYVSVHCTDPELRMKILGNKRAATIREDLQRLQDAGIEIHTQIVLCPGINDGDILKQSIEELAQYYPSVQSIGIVPVGLTGHRDKLAKLQVFTPEQSRELITMIDDYQLEFRKSLHRGLVYLADEFYIKAQVDFPPAPYYDGYEQIENGIGLARVFLDELNALQSSLPQAIPPREVHIVTGISAISVLKKLQESLQHIQGLKIYLLPVENHYFGGNVTVTGLLTGSDIMDVLGTLYQDRIVIIPEVIFREGYDILLDDVSLDQIRTRSGARIRTVDGSARSLVEAVLGLELKIKN